MAHSDPTLRVCIRGRVQGVGYRLWAARKAAELGLTGWVRNRSDGSVETIFQGRAADVDAMIEACRLGPPGAAVTQLETRAEEGETFTRFEVRETG